MVALFSKGRRGRGGGFISTALFVIFLQLKSKDKSKRTDSDTDWTSEEEDADGAESASPRSKRRRRRAPTLMFADLLGDMATSGIISAKSKWEAIKQKPQVAQSNSYVS